MTAPIRLASFAFAAVLLAATAPVATAAGEIVAGDDAWGNVLPVYPIHLSIRASSQYPNVTFEVGAAQHGTIVLEGDPQCFGQFGPVGCSQTVAYTPTDPDYLGPESYTYTAKTSINGFDYSDEGTGSFAIVDDTTPPGCEFGIYGVTRGHDRATDTLAVTARLITSDTQSGVKSVRISNTGTTADGMLTTYDEHPLTTSFQFIDWSLQNATGGSAALGHHTVYAQCSDNFGNWTSVMSKSILYDPLDPVVSTPVVDLEPSADFRGIMVRIRYTYSDTGGSGGYPYEVARSIDGKPWVSIGGGELGGAVNKTLVYTVSAGHSYRYRIRAADDAGNIGPWAYTRTFAPAHYLAGSTAIKTTGTWAGIFYYDVGFHTRWSKQAGATARLTFTGRTVGLIAITGPGRGKARIYLDGALVSTTDTGGSSKNIWVKFQKTWVSSGDHTITVKVLGTVGRPRIEIKEFAVLR